MNNILTRHIYKTFAMKKRTFIMISVFFTLVSNGQVLKPGFEKSECIEMLKIGAKFGDSLYSSKIPDPINFREIYQSPVTGLDNMWELWMNDNGIAVISIRGSTKQATSWLANFYAAMVPANGEMQLSDSIHFNYHLTSNPRAAVHTGWLICTGFLAPDILYRIDSLYKTGIKDFIITGHSQGGAISFIVTSYLYSLQKQNRLPADIRFKTYCIAAPKVGNLYFAYDYEARTQFGWAYNVVNSADWVPECMFSIQTMNDFNNTNPFINAKSYFKKLSFPKDLVLKYFYSRMDQPTRTAEYRFQECLGNYLSEYVVKALPGFKPPEYYNSMAYVRVGNTIVLQADDDYYKLFPDNPNTIFVHHFHQAYLYLAEKLP